MPVPMDNSYDCAVRSDEQADLSEYRSQFHFSPDAAIYMDGNSLGRLPLKTIQRVNTVIRNEWGENLIQSWGDHWINAPLLIGDKIGRLIGARSGEVVVADSTSVNLFKLTMAALNLRPDRRKIITDAPNFPTDLYILQACRRLGGSRHSIVMLAPVDGISMDTDAILQAIDQETALVSLSHVHFKSGYSYDVEKITRRAHAVGALIIWDLSHSAGVVPISLDDWDVDFAVGCSYKYLNGGPGAPAYLFVNRRLQGDAESPIWGWFGQKNPFGFEQQYSPAEGINRFQAGTPPILSLLAIEPGVDMLLEAGMDRIRAKSMRQTQYLISLYDAVLKPLGVKLGSPRDPHRCGSHVSLQHPDGYRINRALIELMHVIPDFREPDNIRLGISPLYTTCVDIWKSVDCIRQVIVEKLYESYSTDRMQVT